MLPVITSCVVCVLITQPEIGCQLLTVAQKALNEQRATETTTPPVAEQTTFWPVIDEVLSYCNAVAFRICQLFRPFKNLGLGEPERLWTIVFHRCNPVKRFCQGCGGFLWIVETKRPIYRKVAVSCQLLERGTVNGEHKI